MFLFDGKSHHRLPDLGTLNKLTLSIDQIGVGGDSWFVERVEFHDLSDGGLAYIFPCGRWLGG